jgi:heavy metal sensor kinase
MHTSIRVRLTAWYVAALALTLVLIGAATFLLTRQSLYHWLDETLADHASDLSREVRFVSGEPRLELPEEESKVYGGVDDGILLLDRTQSVVLARGLDGKLLQKVPAVIQTFRGRPNTGTVETGGEHRWRVATQPILSEGKTAAVLLVGHELRELDEVMERMALVMLTLLPLALLGAGAGGLVLAGRALAPVDEITKSAATISEQDLSKRLPVRNGDELGRLARTFNALIERLEQAFERQRRFTADASHELRTPLSIIRAVTSQKLMRRRTPEEYEEALGQIDEAAGYMARLAAHLLVLARADAGQVRLESERVELVELLEHVAGQVGEAVGRPISVHALPPRGSTQVSPKRGGNPGPVHVPGDPMRLTELFLNLLENATKYTPPEGSIAVDVERRGKEVLVAVKDTGIGIPAEHLPHIFERFYRVDRARAREAGGTGLGLAIARWIVEAHRGSIRAESEPGQGTTMRVTLPAEDEVAE